MPNVVESGPLREETLAAFAEHLKSVEAGSSLWPEQPAERAAAIRKGQTIAEMCGGKKDPIHVPGGLIHDWVGATWIANGNVKNALELVQDYDGHKNIYAPDVMDSKLLGRCGSVFEIYLRLRKHKVKTVVLDTDHHVEYTRIDNARWYCRSHTTRVAEVADAGTESEKVGQPDTGYGYLWRLSSYWRFDEHEGGVSIECRAISLTRDVPTGLGWILEPIIKKLPRESLVTTLEATRRGYVSRFHPCSS